MPFEMDSTISIHAPRKGGDLSSPLRCGPAPYFNPRPREGGDWRVAWGVFRSIPFQSTPPARGATEAWLHGSWDIFISIHAPREGGDKKDGQLGGATTIFQSTPPREGGDGIEKKLFIIRRRFQSTPPARGATVIAIEAKARRTISIHAPREGGDISKTNKLALGTISIHAPREGGDALHQYGQRKYMISIHAPREGGDLVVVLPGREIIGISIHAPREGGDFCCQSRFD